MMRMYMVIAVAAALVLIAVRNAWSPPVVVGFVGSAVSLALVIAAVQLTVAKRYASRRTRP